MHGSPAGPPLPCNTLSSHLARGRFSLEAFKTTLGTHRTGLISDLYQAALQHPPQERSAFLKKACEGDPGLQHELESLLRYESDAARFFESTLGWRPTHRGGPSLCNHWERLAEAAPTPAHRRAWLMVALETSEHHEEAERIRRALDDLSGRTRTS